MELQVIYGEPAFIATGVSVLNMRVRMKWDTIFSGPEDLDLGTRDPGTLGPKY